MKMAVEQNKSLLVIEGDSDLQKLISLRLGIIQKSMPENETFDFSICSNCLKAKELLQTGAGFSVTLADIPAHTDARAESGVNLFSAMHKEGLLNKTRIIFMSSEPGVLEAALKDSLERPDMAGVVLPPVYPNDVGHVISEALNLAGVPAAPMAPDRHKMGWKPLRSSNP